MSTQAMVPIRLMDELREAVDMAVKQAKDPNVVRNACERMDRLREEIFAREGMLDIGVPAIRELRDS